MAQAITWRDVTAADNSRALYQQSLAQKQLVDSISNLGQMGKDYAQQSEDKNTNAFKQAILMAENPDQVKQVLNRVGNNMDITAIADLGRTTIKDLDATQRANTLFDRNTTVFNQGQEDRTLDQIVERFYGDGYQTARDAASQGAAFDLKRDPEIAAAVASGELRLARNFLPIYGNRADRMEDRTWDLADTASSQAFRRWEIGAQAAAERGNTLARIRAENDNKLARENAAKAAAAAAGKPYEGLLDIGGVTPDIIEDVSKKGPLKYVTENLDEEAGQAFNAFLSSPEGRKIDPIAAAVAMVHQPKQGLRSIVNPARWFGGNYDPDQLARGIGLGQGLSEGVPDAFTQYEKKSGTYVNPSIPRTGIVPQPATRNGLGVSPLWSLDRYKK